MYNLTFKNIGIIVILLLSFTSCASGIEIPEDKKEYIGIWTSDTMNLTLNMFLYMNIQVGRFGVGIIEFFSGCTKGLYGLKLI